MYGNGSILANSHVENCMAVREPACPSIGVTLTEAWYLSSFSTPSPSPGHSGLPPQVGYEFLAH